MTMDSCDTKTVIWEYIIVIQISLYKVNK